MNRDKPRIASTIILGLALTTLLFFSIILLPVTWASITESSSSASSSQESAAGQIVAGATVAFALGIGIVLVIFIYAVIHVLSGLCFLFSFKNRQSTLKPIRIISYVYDGLIGVLLLTVILKLILIFAGV